MKDDVKKSIRNTIGDWRFLALIAILTVAAFLRFSYAFFDGVWVDEGRYARLAFELSNHIWSYSTIPEWKGQITGFPPFYPYLLGISTALLGKTDFAVRLVSPVMGVVATGITYLLGREMLDRETGLVAAALVAVNPIIWFLSERILIGATFSALYSVAVLALYVGLSDKTYSRYGLYALGPLVALNIMTKQPAYTLGLIIPLYFIYKKREELLEIARSESSFKDSDIYQDFVLNRDYQLALGFGILTILPWALRNMAVCNVPLCGLSRAMEFASKNPDPALTSVQSTFYYIIQSPVIVTLPVAVIVAARVGQYVLESWNNNPDLFVKKAAFLLVFVGGTFFLRQNLAPMALLTSIAILAETDSEKLLWLWIGLGIGFMSIPQIKVPRYVIFVIPGVAALTAIALKDFAERIAAVLKPESVTPLRIVALVLVPVLFLSYVQGVSMVENPRSFPEGEQAGRWLDSNVPEDTSIAASSPTVLRYYVYPRMSYRLPGNESKFSNFLRENDIGYVAIDTYERTQPQWAQTGIPPYRIPNKLRSRIRSGQMTKEQFVSLFSEAPGFLEPVKNFGKARNPLSGKKQPKVTIYQINRSALP